MSVSPAPDPMERLFSLSPDEQRVFTLEAAPRPPMAASAPEDAAVPEIEATTTDSEEGAVGGKKTGGDGVLATVVEVISNVLEFLGSEVFGSLLKWLLD